MKNPVTRLYHEDRAEFIAWLRIRYTLSRWSVESRLLADRFVDPLSGEDRADLSRIRKESYAHLRAVYKSLHAVKEAQEITLDPGRMMSRGALLVALHYDELVYRRSAYLLARDHDHRSRLKREQVKAERVTFAPEGKPDGERITLSLKDAHMTREEAERVNAALPDRLKIPSLAPKPKPLWGDPGALSGSVTGRLTADGGRLFKSLQTDRRTIGFTIAVDPASKSGADLKPGMMVAIDGKTGLVVPAQSVDLEAAGQRTAEDPRFTAWLRSPDGHLVRKTGYDAATHGMGAEPYTNVLRMRPKDRGKIPLPVLVEEAKRHGWVLAYEGTYTSASATVLANGVEFKSTASSAKDGNTGVEVLKRFALFDALKLAITNLLHDEPALSLNDLKNLCGARGWAHRINYLGLNAGARALIITPISADQVRYSNGSGLTILEAFWSAYRTAQRAGLT